MANMSYCRFENTCGDLQECYDALTDAGSVKEVERTANKYEKANIRRLIELCRDIVDDFGDEEENDEDDDDNDEEEYMPSPYVAPTPISFPTLPDNWTTETLGIEAKKIMEEHSKLTAIKFVKENTGYGLYEAKQFCDNL